jgi:hypothetical protein
MEPRHPLRPFVHEGTELPGGFSHPGGSAPHGGGGPTSPAPLESLLQQELRDLEAAFRAGEERARWLVDELEKLSSARRPVEEGGERTDVNAPVAPVEGVPTPPPDADSSLDAGDAPPPDADSSLDAGDAPPPPTDQG